ncbi:hypothetical protein QPK87_19335 [Kamptonema cortianum]|nr:hypothetical protein [Geitlerinema splendidum]MDK3158710.1 hypothetical protein [Kamptonema cortianum]
MKSRATQIAKWMKSLAVLVMATGATATGVCAALCEAGVCCPPQSGAEHHCCSGSNSELGANNHAYCCGLTGDVEASKSDGVLPSSDSPSVAPKGHDHSWLRPPALRQPQQVARSQVVDSAILDETHTPRGPPVIGD